MLSRNNYLEKKKIKAADGRIKSPGGVKRILCILLSLSMLLSLSGCGGKSSNFQPYVKSLLNSNYLGVTSEYVKLTGANEEDAEALYLQNVTRLADNLSTYYGLDISTDPELAPAMVDLAKQIYSKAKFDVDKAYKDNNIYYVDVTVYPIDILNQTNGQIVQYVNSFNEAVDRGDYNDYTKEEYEYEFASGIIGILAGAVESISYTEPVTLKTRIITTEDSYYIGNEDFREIDIHIINMEIDESMATPTDADTEVPDSTSPQDNEPDITVKDDNK